MDEVIGFFELKLERLKKYCAYQERSHQEVIQKARTLQIEEDDLQTMLVILIEENFLNEERFALAFVRGKQNIKNWGIQKIKYALQAKGVDKHLIHQALLHYSYSQEEQQMLKWIEKRKQNTLRILKIN